MAVDRAFDERPGVASRALAGAAREQQMEQAVELTANQLRRALMEKDAQCRRNKELRMKLLVATSKEPAGTLERRLAQIEWEGIQFCQHCGKNPAGVE